MKAVTDISTLFAISYASPGCITAMKNQTLPLKKILKYSRLSLSRSRRDHLKHFEISVL